MKTTDQDAKTRRMKAWLAVRYASFRRTRIDPTPNESMFERLRTEFALEPVTPTRRSS